MSVHHAKNEGNNTPFFLIPTVLVIGLSYLVMRLDLFGVQLAAMALSFYAHVYIDNQYHLAGSWLDRFSWFRRKQQLHFLHHRHANCNFAVIDYFWDRLLGTYRGVEATRQTPPGASLTKDRRRKVPSSPRLSQAGMMDRAVKSTSRPSRSHMC